MGIQGLTGGRWRVYLLGGSWGLVSRDISTLTGVISTYISSVTLLTTIVTKSPEALSRASEIMQEPDEETLAL